jgi:hypothetical protein
VRLPPQISLRIVKKLDKAAVKLGFVPETPSEYDESEPDEKDLFQLLTQRGQTEAAERLPERFKPDSST